MISAPKELQLSRGYVALVDGDGSFGYILRTKWSAALVGERVYAVRSVKKGGKWKREYLHRILAGAKKGQYVDHQNGDSLDNRLGNLRICTNQQNSFNSRKGKNNKSGYKGVYFYRKLKKFQAYINKDRKRLHLGYFLEKEEAARAYDRAAKELHGEFARLNSPAS